MCYIISIFPETFTQIICSMQNNMLIMIISVNTDSDNLGNSAAHSWSSCDQLLPWTVCYSMWRYKIKYKGLLISLIKQGCAPNDIFFFFFLVLDCSSSIKVHNVRAGCIQRDILLHHKSEPWNSDPCGYVISISIHITKKNNELLCVCASWGAQSMWCHFPCS